MEALTTVSQGACQKACQDKERCRFWTWVKSINKCHLKNAMTIGSTNIQDLISGPKNCPSKFRCSCFCHFFNSNIHVDNCHEDQVDYVGIDLKNFGAESKWACQKACQDDQSCKFWTFMKSGHCWLKSSKTGVIQSKPDLISGPKKCDTVSGHDGK